MFERLIYKKPKLNTVSQIKKALRKEIKKRNKLQKKCDNLYHQMKERETKYEDYYRPKIEEAKKEGNHKEASRLSHENMENNRIYGFIKKDYVQVEHQLNFAKQNVERYQKLLKEKEGSSARISP